MLPGFTQRTPARLLLSCSWTTVIAFLVASGSSMAIKLRIIVVLKGKIIFQRYKQLAL
jgi:hypothetical protein